MNNTQTKLIIFLGDVNDSVTAEAKKLDQSAYLLDRSNYKEFLQQKTNKNTVVYTSLGDLPKDLKVVYHILLQADQIVYCPPDQWSDRKQLDILDPGKSIQGLTEIMLSMLPDSIQIINYNPIVPDAVILRDQRKTNDPQIWNVGCSITHGVGVAPDQRFGQLLSDELNLPCSFLTRPGSAIDWAADQILRSDIRKGDIVIWGITSPDRFTYIHDNKLLAGVTAQSYESFPEYEKIVSFKNLYVQNTFYRHFYAIQQVTNFCKKIKAHLILVGLMSGGYSIQRLINAQKNYVSVDYEYNFKDLSIETKYIDLGTDNEHPGPQQHLKYKQIILQKLKQLEIV